MQTNERNFNELNTNQKNYLAKVLRDIMNPKKLDVCNRHFANLKLNKKQKTKPAEQKEEVRKTLLLAYSEKANLKKEMESLNEYIKAKQTEAIMLFLNNMRYKKAKKVFIKWVEVDKAKQAEAKTKLLEKMIRQSKKKAERYPLATALQEWVDLLEKAKQSEAKTKMLESMNNKVESGYLTQGFKKWVEVDKAKQAEAKQSCWKR